jgi:hypothetical protein
MLFRATFNNISVISWRSVLLALSQNVVSSIPRLGGIRSCETSVVIGTDCIG